MAASKKKRRRKKKGRYHRGLHVSPKGGECKYRSGWELSYMKWLDANPDVETWTYEKLVIEYVSNLKTKRLRRYYPDFYVKYVDGRIEVVEIKPKRRLQGVTVQKKARAAVDWCAQNGATYIMLTEVELKSISII
jgi:hypothetical protein